MSNSMNLSSMNGDFTNVTRQHGVSIRPPEPEWHEQVMKSIHEGTLAEAGYELCKLVNFTLKTEHDEQFNLEVSNCVNAFWNRCQRERTNT